MIPARLTRVESRYELPLVKGTNTYEPHVGRAVQTNSPGSGNETSIEA